MKKTITILFLFISFILNAQTYYISPTGNDAANGSQATPWKTLAKATSTVTAGTIHVNAGTYTETQTSNLKVGVSIEGDGATTTIIKAPSGSEFLSLQSGQNTNGNQSIKGITLNGGYISESNKGANYGIWITGRSNVVIDGCVITGFYQSGVIFDGFDANAPASDPGVSATGNKFINNTMTSCATVNNCYGNGALMIGGQTGMVIQNNVINCTQRPAFKNGWPIKYWDNGYLKGVKILNNTLVKAPYQATYWGQNCDWDFAIELFNISGLEIGGNTIQGAIDLNYNYKGNYTYSLWAHDNILNHATPNYTHSESGFILEFKTESAIIENNTINNAFVGVSYNTRGPGNHGGYSYNCGTGGCSAITDNIIRNNLFTNLYSSYGVSGAVIVQSEGTDDPYVSNLQIYNNTFVAKSTQGSPVGIDMTSQSGGNISGVNINHNIFQGFTQGSVRGNAAATQSNIVIQSNDYYLTSAPTWSGNGVNISANLNVNPNFDATYHATNPSLNGIGWNGTNNPPPPCTSFSYGAWSACSASGQQTRTYTALPAGCAGNPPSDSITRSCTPPPPACTYTYSAWSTCVNGQQSRTVLSSSPAGCVGTPILTQSCTTPVCTYTYSAWSACNNGTQTRTILSSSPTGCAGTPILSQNCSVTSDTIYAVTILYGNNLTRRNITYFVKRSDGFLYDNTGVKRDIHLYKSAAGYWLYKDGTNWVQLF